MRTKPWTAPVGRAAGGASFLAARAVILALAAFAPWSCARSPIGPLGASVEAPSFATPPGVYRAPLNLALAPGTSGATIRYATSATAALSDSSAWTDYSAPISVAATTTIRAYSFVDRSNISSVATGIFTMKVADPSIAGRTGWSDFPASVEIVCLPELAGTTIRYTLDGTPPLTSGTAATYTHPVPIEAATTVRAYAYRTGWSDSGESTATISIDSSGSLPPVVLSGIPSPLDEPFVLQASCADAAALIRYTTDGTAPSFLNGIDFPTAGLPISATNAVPLRIASMRPGYAINELPSQTFTMSVADPVASPAAGSYVSDQPITLSTVTPGATIRYTTDGSDPLSSGTAADYASPLPSSTMTLRAYALRAGWTSSATVSSVLAFNTTSPAAFPAGGAYAAPVDVHLDTTTPSGSMQYSTDGGSSWTAYSAPIPIVQTTTVLARTTRAGWTAAAPAAYIYAMTVADPVLSLPAASYPADQVLAISTSTPGATIRYTTDGSPPTAASAAYTAPIAVDRGMTVRAYAERTGWTSSSVASAAYSFVTATPSMAPAGGTYSSPLSVYLSDASPSVALEYSLDGGTTWSAYSGSVTVAQSLALLARATRAGWGTGSAASQIYAMQVAAPTLYPAGGSYGAPLTVYFSSATPGAGFEYSTDGGSTWSPGSSVSLNAPGSTTALSVRGTRAGWTNSSATGASYAQ